MAALGHIETARVLTEAYRATGWTDFTALRRQLVGRDWLGHEGALLVETHAIDRVLTALRGNRETIVRYVLGNIHEANSITCGFYLNEKEWPPREHSPFGNETIPDHFAGYLGLRKPFTVLSPTDEAVTTPHIEELQRTSRDLLDTCYVLKKDILGSNTAFKQFDGMNDNYIEWATGQQILYLQGEAERIQDVSKIARGMKTVYGDLTKILYQMGK